MLYVRDEKVPKVVRITLKVNTADYPELGGWLWSHPWVATEALRRVLTDACNNGALDAKLREIERAGLSREE